MSMDEMNASTGAPRFLDTARPNITRMYNYFMGGSTHYEVDRQAAELMLQRFPQVKNWVRLGRAFIQEAVRTLYQEGFVQFLDLGSGIPSEDHIHTLAPAANVVYTDINPVAISYGSSLYDRLSNVEYVHGDVRNLSDVYRHPIVMQLINREQKTAVGLNYVPLYMDLEHCQQMARSLYEWTAPGSQLFQLLYVRTVPEDDPNHLAYQQFTEQAGFRMRLWTQEEILEGLYPWVPRRMVPITKFLGLPDDFLPAPELDILGLNLTAAFFMKHSETGNKPHE